MASAVRALHALDTAPPPAPSSTKENDNRPVTATSDPEASAQAADPVKDVLAAVDRVLCPDRDGAVDLRRVVTVIWTRRSDAEFTTELCSRLPRLPLDRRSLDQAEFFLPQLAHMVVHLDQQLPVEPLERFVLRLAASSLHLALQLFWSIYAALDENRPKRPAASPRAFARCAQLLLALEQCVVYGSPAVQSTVESPLSVVTAPPQQVPSKDTLSGGWLLKKGGGTSAMGRRNWSRRWCRLENRILLVFNKPSDEYPRAAVPVAGAEVVVADHPKHPHYFEVVHSLSETRAKFAAQSRQERDQWVDALSRTASAPEPPVGASPVKAPGSPSRAISRMSVAMRSFLMDSAAKSTAVDGEDSGGQSSENDVPSEAGVDGSAPPLVDSHASLPSVEPVDEGTQETGGDKKDHAARSEFFSGMIRFVKAITDVSEALRRAEPPKRKAMLRPLLEKVEVPPLSYIPLCRSTDPFCPVHAILRTEGRVFNTNERAPCLLYFETVESDDGLNVAQALAKHLGGQQDVVGSEDLLRDGQGGAGSEDAEADASVGGATTQLDPCSPSQQLDSSTFMSKLLEDETRRQHLELVFGELSFSSTDRLRANSDCECKATPKWRLTPLIAKSFDDLRQEVLVMQLLSFFQQVFRQERLPLWLRPYRILSTGASTGLIEVVQNATSLDSVKKTPGFRSLRALFDQVYGERGEDGSGGDGVNASSLRRQAELNFIHSLAAYSIVCYILAVKDRHNGNIMLDVEGHIIHIDFGFFLGRAPGGSFSFETAPFKLTAEMAEVLGGRTSADFEYFSDLCARGALAVRKHADTLYALVETMSSRSKMPCFAGGAAAPLAGLRDRLFLNMAEDKVRPAVRSMIQRAYDHFGTTKYDQFQVFSNGIAK